MLSSSTNYQVLADSIFEDLLAWKNINQVYTYIKDNKKAGIVSTKLALNQIAEKMFNKVEHLNSVQLSKMKEYFNQKDWELFSFIICEQNLINNQQSSQINL